jgi:hypothetical protein
VYVTCFLLRKLLFHLGEHDDVAADDAALERRVKPRHEPFSRLVASVFTLALHLQ